MNIDKLWKKYNKEKPSFYSLGLQYVGKNSDAEYFCTPKGAKIFASLGVGGIHYCTIYGYGETVFAVVPDGCNERYVFPVANDLMQFLQMVIFLGGAGMIDQIPTMSKESYNDRIKNPYSDLPDDMAEGIIAEITAEAEKLQEMFELMPLDGSPYDIVTGLCANFDDSKIEYTDEYYDTLGI